MEGVTVAVLVVVGVRVGVSVGTRVGVGVLVAVSMSVGVSVGARVGVLVAVSVSVGVRVGVSVGVLVAVSVSVGVRVGVSVGVLVAVSVSVGVRVGVSVGLRFGLIKRKTESERVTILGASVTMEKIYVSAGTVLSVEMVNRAVCGFSPAQSVSQLRVDESAEAPDGMPPSALMVAVNPAPTPLQVTVTA